MRGTGLGIIAAAAAALICAFPTSGEAAVRFSQPLTLPGTRAADDPEVAIDSQGRATVVWTTYSGLDTQLEAVRIGADGVPGTVTTLAADGYEAQVAIDAEDRATVVWSTINGIHSLRVAADGTPGPERTYFSTAGEYGEGPRVAVDSLGRATIVWEHRALGEAWIEMARVGSDGVPGPVEVISDVEDGNAREPDVAVDSQDRATVVWTRSAGSGSLVERLRITVNGTPGEPLAISEAGHESWEPQLAIDPQDRATVVWQRGDEDGRRIQAARLDSAGAPEPIRTLSGPLGPLPHPRLAVDALGRATVVWQRFEGSLEPGAEELRWSVEGARIGADGTAEASRPLSGEGADGATVAIDPANRVWVAWNRSDGFNSRIEARRIGADGTTGSVRILSPAEKDSYGPQLAIDSKYRPTLAWRRSTAGNRIEVTRGQPRIPETVIEAGPNGPTDDPSPVFTFSSPDIDVEGFECGLDGGGFDPCASPVTAVSLPDGLHRFEVRAIDEGGVRGGTESRSFVVDTTPPVIERIGIRPKGGRPIVVTGSNPPPEMPGRARAERVLRVRNGRALLKIRCSGDGACSGTAKLFLLRASSDGRQRRVAAGSGRFLVPAGGTNIAALTLTGLARRLVGGAGPAGLSALLEGTRLEPRPVSLKLAKPRG